MEVWVSSCTPCLLYIVLQRVGDVVVDDQSYIALVHTHSEGGCSNDDAYLVGHEGILIVYLFIGIHLAIIGQGSHAVTSQLHGEFSGSLGSGYVDDGRAVCLLHKIAQEVVFVSIAIHVDHGIVQIGT